MYQDETICNRRNAERTNNVLPYKIVNGREKDAINMARINLGVSILAQVAENASQRNMPAYIKDGEVVDWWVRISDVEDAISKCLNEE